MHPARGLHQAGDRGQIDPATLPRLTEDRSAVHQVEDRFKCRPPTPPASGTGSVRRVAGYRAGAGASRLRFCSRSSSPALTNSSSMAGTACGSKRTTPMMRDSW